MQLKQLENQVNYNLQIELIDKSIIQNEIPIQKENVSEEKNKIM